MTTGQIEARSIRKKKQISSSPGYLRMNSRTERISATLTSWSWQQLFGAPTWRFLCRFRKYKRIERSRGKTKNSLALNGAQELDTERGSDVSRPWNPKPFWPQDGTEHSLQQLNFGLGSKMSTDLFGPHEWRHIHWKMTPYTRNRHILHSTWWVPLFLHFGVSLPGCYRQQTAVYANRSPSRIRFNPFEDCRFRDRRHFGSAGNTMGVMGSPLRPGWNGGGFSNIPNPTGSSANFSSQGCADSALQVIQPALFLT